MVGLGLLCLREKNSDWEKIPGLLEIKWLVPKMLHKVFTCVAKAGLLHRQFLLSMNLTRNISHEFNVKGAINVELMLNFSREIYL